jgi:hypothetical protein
MGVSCRFLRGRERCPLLDAANGHVREASACITRDKPLQIFQNLDDPLAMWLFLAGRLLGDRLGSEAVADKLGKRLLYSASSPTSRSSP